jgi:hypothetical protein
MRSLTEGSGHEDEVLRGYGLALHRLLGAAVSREVSEGIVLDYDVNGRPVGIDIDNATSRVDLERLIVSSLPGEIQTDAA